MSAPCPPPPVNLRPHHRPSLPRRRRRPTHLTTLTLLRSSSEPAIPASNAAAAVTVTVAFEIQKTGRNSRRIAASVPVAAPLDALWAVLTDYERLADFIPGLAVSRLLEKADHFARLFQVGEQNLGLGIKFNAKGVVECYEGEVEVLSYGLKRDIEFKMVEGDFKVFQGKWGIVQLDAENSEECDNDMVEETQSILPYIVDVEPKLWLPVGLVEGGLCKEVEVNLVCIKEQAQKGTDLFCRTTMKIGLKKPMSLYFSFHCIDWHYKQHKFATDLNT